MFILELKYIVELSKIDEHLASHRRWLDAQYQKGLLLCSGPKNPRVGGIIIALGQDRASVEQLIKDDPFTIHDLAEYTITEFIPVKFHAQLKDLV